MLQSASRELHWARLTIQKKDAEIRLLMERLRQQRIGFLGPASETLSDCRWSHDSATEPTVGLPCQQRALMLVRWICRSSTPRYGYSIIERLRDQLTGRFVQMPESKVYCIAIRTNFRLPLVEIGFKHTRVDYFDTARRYSLAESLKLLLETCRGTEIEGEVYRVNVRVLRHSSGGSRSQSELYRPRVRCCNH